MSKLGLDALESLDVDLSSLKSLTPRPRPAPAKGAIRPVTALIDTSFTPASPPAAETGCRERVVKDSFTFPPEDHAQLERLTERALRSGKRLGKSALVRAGLKVLASMDDAAFAGALDGIEEVKRGPRRR